MANTDNDAYPEFGYVERERVVRESVTMTITVNHRQAHDLASAIDGTMNETAAACRRELIGFWHG